jgi:ubiquinol-cytochrome c reductase iron-sulfur subunit
MTPDQLATLAANLDDVEIVHNARKFPIPGTRAEKRAERAVALWFVISALSGLAFLLAFLFWPFEYVPPSDPGYGVYALYTPVIGGTFGLAVLALGIGVISYVKKFFPDEVSVQQRHDGISDEVDRRTVIAQLQKAGQDTGIARRKLITRAAGGAAGVFGLGLGIAAIAPLVRNPWEGGDLAALWTTGWRPVDGETVYLRRDTGIPDEISLVRPEDQEPGSMETVFPFRESERGDEEALLHALRRSDNPVMLIRLRPGTEVTQRSGQEDFHYGDFYAYSKLCTHLGCPTSLYETQSQRHPVPVPPERSSWPRSTPSRSSVRPPGHFPQLPITVNDEGLPRRHRRLPRGSRTRLLGAEIMSSITTPTTSGGGGNALIAGALDGADQRYHAAAGMRKQFNKVFPTHWSFMLGEIALYSFIILLLTGHVPGAVLRPLHGRGHLQRGLRQPLRGIHMSKAYESALDISFEVRGGLFVRQVHHWAALLFAASMIVHMFRIFFTGAFRKPREANWVIGIVLILAARSRASPATRCPTTCSRAPACASRRASR